MNPARKEVGFRLRSTLCYRALAKAAKLLVEMLEFRLRSTLRHRALGGVETR
jgi:hypothetical protein